MFLARKITRAKWGEQPDMPVGRIAADAVTADLRTQDNALSFWRCGAVSPAEISEAVLALAAGSERLDKVDLVWVAEADLRTDGLMLAETSGKTPVRSLADQHVDVRELDYGRLGKVAERVLSALRKGCYRRVTKGKVRSIFAGAIADRRLQHGELQRKVASEVAG